MPKKKYSIKWEDDLPVSFEVEDEVVVLCELKSSDLLFLGPRRTEINAANE